MKRRHLPLIFASMMTWSCSHDLPTTMGNDELLPLKVGNSWEYEIAGDTRTDLWKVVELADIAGEQAFRVTLPGRDDIYLNHKAEGVYLYSTSRGRFEILWKYPTEVGDSFQAVDLYFSKFQSATRTMETRSSVDVPAGRFDDCVRYEFAYKFLHNFGYEEALSSVYIKPGLGVMKYAHSYHYSSIYGTNEGSFTLDLIRFRIK